LVERVFTTVYLYAVNECHLNAKDNLEYVDRKSYTTHSLEATNSGQWVFETKWPDYTQEGQQIFG
jgi:hypothetical protein